MDLQMKINEQLNSPVGERFSQVYLKDETLLRDSPRFRKRLSAFLSQKVPKNYSIRFALGLTRVIGIVMDRMMKIPYSPL